MGFRERLMGGVMKLASSGGGVVEVGGLRVIVAPSVSNPAPALGRSFAPLYDAALVDLAEGARVLELGTGCGVWALLAVRAGADVTATDLPGVPLEPVRASAELNSLAAPRCLSGDLFGPVERERFHRVLFNPPFHLGEPKDASERAYFGGANGEVVRRFLRELPAHLEAEGRGFIILPRKEQRAYAPDLAPLRPRPLAHLSLPVLGRAELLELRAP